MEELPLCAAGDSLPKEGNAEATTRRPRLNWISKSNRVAAVLVAVALLGWIGRSMGGNEEGPGSLRLLQAGGEEGAVGLFLLLGAYLNRNPRDGTGNSRPPPQFNPPQFNPPQFNPPQLNPRTPTPAPVVETPLFAVTPPTAPPTATPTISTPPPTASPTAPPTAAPTTLAPTPQPTACFTPDLFVCENDFRGRRIGDHCGLTYEIFGSGVPELGIAEDAKTSCMTNVAKGFKASWKQADGNYLARKGVRPGGRRYTIDYTVTVFLPGVAPAGLSLLGAYGFTTDPLVEYYIVENWGVVQPPPPIVSAVFLGNFTTSEGVKYKQYRTVRQGKPSVEGRTSTFDQFWSIRESRSFGGSINVAEHFAAWESQGYRVGNFFEVSFVAEALNTEGFAEVDLEIKRN